MASDEFVAGSHCFAVLVDVVGWDVALSRMVGVEVAVAKVGQNGSTWRYLILFPLDSWISFHWFRDTINCNRFRDVNNHRFRHGEGKGGNFLDYGALFADPHDGQHYGILIIELGIGITVAAVMINVFFSLSERSL